MVLSPVNPVALKAAYTCTPATGIETCNVLNLCIKTSRVILRRFDCMLTTQSVSLPSTVVKEYYILIKLSLLPSGTSCEFPCDQAAKIHLCFTSLGLLKRQIGVFFKNLWHVLACRSLGKIMYFVSGYHNECFLFKVFFFTFYLELNDL